MKEKQRVRRVYSVSSELLSKSREAALAAVQVFNNPLITFKSEIFVVLMNIAWTYLLHAYFHKKGVEYRYFKQKPKRRVFEKTRHGAYKHWELQRCLNDKESPIDRDTANNLNFLIGIRNEIEHQMTFRIDSSLSAKFQACCLNYNEYLKELFDEKHGIDKHLAFSLQFSSISQEQLESLPSVEEMPSHINGFIDDFEKHLSYDEYNSPRFAYRVLFVPKTANRKGQADKVIEFIKADSPLAENVNKAYAVIKEKETEKMKYLPSQIVDLMHKDGYKLFKMHHHTALWKEHDARNSTKDYGTMVAGKYWHWYGNWVDVVKKHCRKHKIKYEGKNG